MLILLTFHVAEASGHGFQIAFNVVPGTPGCGGTYTAVKGEISSPTNADNNYHNNMICDYLIKLPENMQISIVFTRFAIEESNDCKFDNIQVN